MPLPLSRNTTYAPGSQVKSADLNALQDAIVALRGPRVRHFSPALGRGLSCVQEDTPIALLLSAATRVVFPLAFDVGDRISALTFARRGDGTADITAAELRVTDAAGTDVTAASIPGGVINPGGGGFLDSALTFAAPVTIGAGQQVNLLIVSNAANIRIGSIRVTYDRP